ncbi:MAG: autotransporter outer membrane beta-barrel domain-containing protein, partial [Gammaproteobacteria bacterium]|nr:autotransporter outer membrane beta-barrel domain-containing protein [Gammaproteobacteria bacterium]
GGGNTLSLWGRGNYSSLEGEPLAGGTRYDYDGDSYGFYLGLDSRYDDYLAGVAVGYTAGDVSLRAASGPAAGAVERSDFESDLVAVYPYAAWQPSERVSVWLLAGYGQGELEIEERAGTTTRKAASDTDLLLGAAGLSWRRPTGNAEILLRLSGTVLHGETDGGSFDDDTPYAKTETDAQQLRGEGELGQVFAFGDDGRLRPYLRAGMSYDFGDGARDAATGEFGAGIQLHWPRLGLEMEWEGEARLASKDGRDYREYGSTGTLRYDLGGDRRGLSVALRPEFGWAQGAADGTAGVAPLDGGAFGGVSSPGAGGRGNGQGSGLGLRSELSYGIGGVRLAPRALPGLLMLYGESGLASGASSYGGGLRFEAERFSLDAGLRREGGADSDSEFLLDATLRF